MQKTGGTGCSSGNSELNGKIKKRCGWAQPRKERSMVEHPPFAVSKGQSPMNGRLRVGREKARSRRGGEGQSPPIEISNQLLINQLPINQSHFLIQDLGIPMLPNPDNKESVQNGYLSKS